MQLVHDFLEQSAQRTPTKTALVFEDKRLTYADLDGMANKLAQAMCAQGVRRGDRILLWLSNSVELAVAIFAALKANAVFVTVNVSTKPDKLQYLASNCRAAALVTQQHRQPLLAQLQERTPSLRCVILTGAADEATAEEAHSFDRIQQTYPPTPPSRQVIDQDLACLIYTSGSTGQPKGVMCAHSNVVFAASSIITYLQNTDDDVVNNVLPLSFDYGLYQLLMTFKFGGTLVLEKGFTYPAHVLKRMERERVTGFPAVPTIFATMLQMDLQPYDLSSLRYMSNTGAALPPSHIEKLQTLCPGATIYSMYGLTETKRTLFLPPDQLTVRPGSVGIAIPGTEVWLEDKMGRRVGPGELGELVIRGRHVMRGYWENPEATAVRYRPGPLPGERICYSGDQFRMDEDGYLYFVGREDDIIKSRGEKVAPKEIEDVLYRLPGVVEAAAVGVPDPILGQAIKLFVVSRDNDLTVRDVLRHCRTYLEDFMMPKFVELCDQLPKTDSGKIKKTDLS